MSITTAMWKVTVRCTNAGVKVLVTDTWMEQELLKARLPEHPCHPRALLTLCEGLALWHGGPLRTAVSADADAGPCFERIFYDGALIEPHSPLVVLEVDPERARKRGGRRGRVSGDFRLLRSREDER